MKNLKKKGKPTYTIIQLQNVFFFSFVNEISQSEKCFAGWWVGTADRTPDLRRGSLACQQSVQGQFVTEAVAVLCPCSPWLGFALAACGSIQGTVGRLLQWCFVLCPLWGLEFVCHGTQHPKCPTSEVLWKSHNKKQMARANSVILARGKCSNIAQILVMEKQWKECGVFTGLIFLYYLTYLLSLPEANPSSQNCCTNADAKWWQNEENVLCERWQQLIMSLLF